MIPSSNICNLTETRHIARPPNCFMIWSTKMRETLYTNKTHYNNVEISKILGLMWMNMSDDEKLPYIIEADKVKYAHKIKNPNYKYTPKSKKGGNTKKITIVRCNKVFKDKKNNIILNRRATSRAPTRSLTRARAPAMVESEVEKKTDPYINTDFLIQEPDYFLEVQQFYEQLCSI